MEDEEFEDKIEYDNEETKNYSVEDETFFDKTRVCAFCKEKFKHPIGWMLYTFGKGKNTKVFCSYNCRSKWKQKHPKEVSRFSICRAEMLEKEFSKRQMRDTDDDFFDDFENNTPPTSTKSKFRIKQEQKKRREKLEKETKELEEFLKKKAEKNAKN